MRKTTLFLVLALTLVLAAPGGAPAASRQLLFGATQTASSAYAYYATMAEVIGKSAPELSVTVVETGGGWDNLARIMKGQVDFGQVSPDIGYMAFTGTGRFAGKEPYKKLRRFEMSVGFQQNLMVRKDSGLTKVEELTGKKFHPGMRGSSTEMNTEMVLAALGVKPDYYRGGSGDAVNALKNGHIVGQAKSSAGGRLDSASMEVNTFTPLLFLNFSPEQRQTATEKIPYLVWLEQPKGFVKDQPAFWTFEIPIGFVTTTDLPAEVVYAIVKALRENNARIVSVFKPLAKLDLVKNTIDKSEVPLHAGAVKYFRELGYQVPEKLVPPEMN